MPFFGWWGLRDGAPWGLGLPFDLDGSRLGGVGVPQTGPDQITEGGGGPSYLGTIGRMPVWSDDSRVTLPPVELAPRTSDIASIMRRPLLASDVIPSIEGGDILLSAREGQAPGESRYVTWYFDEAKGRLVEKAQDEDDILFLAARFGDPTARR